MFQPRFAILVVIILLSALYRIIPHPFNFTPIGAIALFAGAKFWDKHVAVLVTLLSMLLADLYLGLYNSIIFTYLGLCSMVYIGTVIQKKESLINIVIAGVTGSLAFYVISNFGVWLLSGMYDHTMNGLAECYLLAIPFLQNSLNSTLFFSFLFFSIFYLLEQRYPLLKTGNTI
ncbi:Uncharacterised protein [Legionella lansingensis]|uniref:Rod shape-determining protein MreD n=1 Tax=Legionella lansingensis TaxID=45067 RepID=A0A0W0V781_9GAMM|nr:DUF6580 family putative transport protein [Legionella lansingensis]KTD15935.1 hypothetical protein Llan_2607 [Legionella lansingensis]SNV48106.1 Uncharacterised protein [Legionella lansingensis]